METKPQIQSGAISTVTITLAPGAYNTGLSQIPLNKENWDAEDQLRFVETLLDNLHDPDGKKVTLPENPKDRIRLVYRQVQETQQRVLLQAFADAGFVLDESTRNTFLSLISSTEFAKWLAKNVRPDTGVPYITVKKTRGVKSKMFDQLATSTAPAAPAGNAEKPSSPTPEVPPQLAAAEAPPQVAPTEPASNATTEKVPTENKA